MRLDTPTLVIDEQGNRGPVTPDVGVGSGHDDVYQHRFMTSVDVMKFKSFLSVTLGAGRLGLQEVLPEGLGGWWTGVRGHALGYRGQASRPTPTTSACDF